MKYSMNGWTWENIEVKHLLQWMCEYNKDKPEDQRLQYTGVDCQVDNFESDQLNDYLHKTGAPFRDTAAVILDNVKKAGLKNFWALDQESFNKLEDKVKMLQDSMNCYEKFLSETGSKAEFKLNSRILRIIEQIMYVEYYHPSRYYSFYYRDQYMAENAAWWSDFFNRKKMFLWAHNGHIAMNPHFYLNSPSVGYYLDKNVNINYIVMGTQFSRGSFYSVGNSGKNQIILKSFTINEEPKSNSLNAILHDCDKSDFVIKISDLQKHEQRTNLFISPDTLWALEIGGSYNGKPEDNYVAFYPHFYNYLIYLDSTTASHLNYY